MREGNLSVAVVGQTADIKFRSGACGNILMLLLRAPHNKHEICPNNPPKSSLSPKRKTLPLHYEFRQFNVL
jgi:hypothetical protein